MGSQPEASEARAAQGAFPQRVALGVQTGRACSTSPRAAVGGPPAGPSRAQAYSGLEWGAHPAGACHTVLGVAQGLGAPEVRANRFSDSCPEVVTVAAQSGMRTGPARLWRKPTPLPGRPPGCISSLAAGDTPPLLSPVCTREGLGAPDLVCSHTQRPSPCRQANGWGLSGTLGGQQEWRQAVTWPGVRVAACSTVGGGQRHRLWPQVATTAMPTLNKKVGFSEPQLPLKERTMLPGPCNNVSASAVTSARPELPPSAAASHRSGLSGRGFAGPGAAGLFSGLWVPRCESRAGRDRCKVLVVWICGIL